MRVAEGSLLIASDGTLPEHAAPFKATGIRCLSYSFWIHGSLGNTNGKPFSVMVYLYVPDPVFVSLHMNLVLPSRWQASGLPLANAMPLSEKVYPGVTNAHLITGELFLGTDTHSGASILQNTM